MPSIPSATFLAAHVALLLRLAGVVSILSGLIGGGVWFVDLLDRDDGDSLRLGFWHNPFMQFPPFHEPFLDLSLHVLLACSAAAGCGGVLLLIPNRWGVPLVTWQARVSIITHGVIAFFIVAMIIVLENRQWGHWHLSRTPEALVLRLGSVAIDLMLWAFLGSKTVREFWTRQSHRPERAFGVVMRDSGRSR